MKKVGALLLAICMCFSLCACNASVSRFEKEVRDGKYADAIETYSSKITKDAALETEADRFLFDYLYDSWEDYLDEELSESEFRAVLRTLEKIEDRLGILGWEFYNIEDMHSQVQYSREQYSTGLKQLENGDYTGAMTSFSSASSYDTKHYDDAADKYDDAKDCYISEIVSRANQMISEGKFSEAYDLASNAEYTVGYAEDELQDVMKKACTAEFESQMRACAEANDYASMVRLYDGALDTAYCDVSSEMTALLSEQKQAYIQDIISRSVSLYQTSGYAAANSVISEGLAVEPENADLLRYAEMYQSCEPVSLLDKRVNIIDSHLIDTGTSSIKDFYANNYTSGYVKFWNNPYTLAPYAEISLGGQYTEFSALVFVKNDKDDEALCLNIYADGVCIYSSGDVSRRTDAFQINLDVSHVRVLKFTIEGKAEYCYLVNTQLSRTLTDADLRG